MQLPFKLVVAVILVVGHILPLSSPFRQAGSDRVTTANLAEGSSGRLHNFVKRFPGLVDERYASMTLGLYLLDKEDSCSPLRRLPMHSNSIPKRSVDKARNTTCGFAYSMVGPYVRDSAICQSLRLQTKRVAAGESWKRGCKGKQGGRAKTYPACSA